MKLVKVDSSNVESVGYEGDVLYVKYISGGLYSYDKVPVIKFISLINSDSIGRYINTEIKGNYTYVKIN